MIEKPFIHLFKTTKGQYCYDVNKDEIIQLPDDVYMYLAGKGEKTDYVKTYIEQLYERGYLKSKRVITTKHPATDYLSYYYKTKLNFLILQVTQNCNLRCEYCVYSGNYRTRSHNNKRMSFDLAQKGIDFLYQHSRDSTRIIIGFYGGEPLLEFDLIKKCVFYIEKLFYGKKVIFTITTNATLLKESIVEFLVEKNFNLIISLDGPKEIHDKSRRFPNSKKSSYETLMENLRYIRKHYCQFYKNNISFNIVFTMSDGFDCVNNFFSTDELFSESEISSGVVSDCFLKEERKIGVNELKYIEQVRYEEFKIMLNQIGELNDAYISKILSKEFDNIIKDRFNKKGFYRDGLPDKWHHGGPCVVGVNRLFMNVYGDFYPCEKVCEEMEEVKIGNIYDGLNIEKAKTVLNIEKSNENECHNCWAYQYCSICATRFGDSPEVHQVQCHRIKRFVEGKLKDYCVLKELGIEDPRFSW